MDLDYGNYNNESLKNEFRAKILPVLIFISSEVFIGLVGNIVVLIVYGFWYEKSTYRCFILFLGMIDLVSCFTTMTGEIVSETFWFTYGFPVICKIKSFFNLFTVSADVLCLVTISIDRYKQICLPHTIQLSPQLASYLCLGISMTAALMAIPAAVVSGLNHTKRRHEGNETNITLCAVSDDHKHTDFDPIYVLVMQVATGLSLTGMLLVYGLIMMKLCCSNRKDVNEPLLNGSHFTLDQGTRRQTLVMFTVSLFFAITVIMYLALDRLMAQKIEKLSLDETVIFLLCFRLYFINHVINPFIYGCLDPKFRANCTRAIGRRSQSFTRRQTFDYYQGKPS